MPPSQTSERLLRKCPLWPPIQQWRPCPTLLETRPLTSVSLLCKTRSRSIAELWIHVDFNHTGTDVSSAVSSLPKTNDLTPRPMTCLWLLPPVSGRLLARFVQSLPRAKATQIEIPATLFSFCSQRSGLAQLPGRLPAWLMLFRDKLGP